MAEPAATASADRRGVGAGPVLATVGVIAVVLTSIVLGVWVLAGSGADTRTYVIEAGTGERLDRGEEVELMPTEVRLSVGDTLELRNEDDREYVVGPYLVRAGETITQQFQRAQTLVGECSLSGSGEIRIVVS